MSAETTELTIEIPDYVRQSLASAAQTSGLSLAHVASLWLALLVQQQTRAGHIAIQQEQSEEPADDTTE